MAQNFAKQTAKASTHVCMYASHQLKAMHHITACSIKFFSDVSYRTKILLRAILVNLNLDIDLERDVPNI